METINFKAKFHEEDSFKLKWNPEIESFKADLGVYMEVAHDPYTGITDVIPSLERQILPTRNKNLATNITVRSIPFEEVSNEEGGYTATIGGY